MQGLHEGVALLAGRALVGEESFHFIHARWHTGEIEEDTADELVVRAKCAGQNLHALPLRGALLPPQALSARPVSAFLLAIRVLLETEAQP